MKKSPSLNPIEPPDSHALSAATGWLELGNPAEAEAELDKIAPEIQSNPQVLVIRYEVLACAKKWDAAAAVSQQLIQAWPENPGIWTHQAYAVRRSRDGGIEKARRILLEAAQRFPKVDLIAYNLACYECQLGRLDESRRWLDKARSLGGAAIINQMALQDEDLQPLWKEIGAGAV